VPRIWAALGTSHPSRVGFSERNSDILPKHLSDQNFDHDYYFKLPLQGASGMPNQVDDALPHAMSGYELSRVRTEFDQLRIVPAIAPHPVQPNG